MGIDALRALAHPLRVRLYSELSSYGPATASALAVRLGESSGATSYHLRQLERHGFVREDEARGTGRDRWWERVPGPIELADGSFDSSPAGREAGDLVELELVRLENERFGTYWANRRDLDAGWREAAQSTSANLSLTPEELTELGAAVLELIADLRARNGHEGAAPDGTERRRIDVTFRAFPVLGRAGPAAEQDGSEA